MFYVNNNNILSEISTVSYTPYYSENDNNNDNNDDSDDSDITNKNNNNNNNNNNNIIKPTQPPLKNERNEITDKKIKKQNICDANAFYTPNLDRWHFLNNYYTRLFKKDVKICRFLFEYGKCKIYKGGNKCINGIHIKRCNNYNLKNNYHCKFGDKCRFIHTYINQNRDVVIKCSRNARGSNYYWTPKVIKDGKGNNKNIRKIKEKRNEREKGILDRNNNNNNNIINTSDNNKNSNNNIIKTSIDNAMILTNINNDLEN